jgi:hypothetical protein
LLHGRYPPLKLQLEQVDKLRKQERDTAIKTERLKQKLERERIHEKEGRRKARQRQERQEGARRRAAAERRAAMAEGRQRRRDAADRLVEIERAKLELERERVHELKRQTRLEHRKRNEEQVYMLPMLVPVLRSQHPASSTKPEGLLACCLHTHPASKHV